MCFLTLSSFDLLELEGHDVSLEMFCKQNTSYLKNVSPHEPACKMMSILCFGESNGLSEPIVKQQSLRDGKNCTVSYSRFGGARIAVLKISIIEPM